MQQKIQELTEKIYREGVEKGDAEAGRIVEEGRAEAEKIVAEAKKEADAIREQAEKDAAEQKRNNESELKLSSQQAIDTVKQQMLNLVTARAVDDAVSASFADPQTVKEYVSAVIENWKSSGEAPELEVLLPEARREELEKVFKKGVFDVLSKGIEVSFGRGIKGGFQVSQKDGAFKVTFTDEDFSEFFKSFLRPKTRTFLFGE